jgi:L-2-hydroxyglutarate oxidase LhgO
LNERKHYHVVIVGGGILGCSIAYLLSYNLGSGIRILLIEQESSPAFHASSRNTGKVHAPFLYDPSKRKLFARAASLGFDMLSDYCQARDLPFIKDGVLEVATEEDGIPHLHRYLEWGYSNGLHHDELRYLDRQEVATLEPNVRCKGAIHCTRDASVSYGKIASSLLTDAQNLGCEVMFATKVVSLKSREHAYSDKSYEKHERGSADNQHNLVIRLKLVQTYKVPSLSQPPPPPPTELPSGVRTGSFNYPIADSFIKHLPSDKQMQSVSELSTDYLINVAGGAALHLAQAIGFARAYAVLHFRGEYWVAPSFLRDLTKMSIYSVPKYPHWVVRIDGRREVGPNALLVSGPFAYDWHQNMRLVIPKIMQSIRASGRLGLVTLFSDKRFLSLVIHEFRSSLSKRVMINRAKRFLPALDPSQFTIRGTSGIRSSLVDKNGKFVPDIIIVGDEDSVHMLNYNSPGATGALPIAALIVDRVMKLGKFRNSGHTRNDEKGVSSMGLNPVTNWDIRHISEYLTENHSRS